MLNPSEWKAWCCRLNLNEPAQNLIEHVRSSGPARRVGGGRFNVSGLYPSRKMGVTIQFESHRVELAAIYAMEHDPLTLEFYDQPPSIMLDYNSAKGRRLSVRHTPDSFCSPPGLRRLGGMEDGRRPLPAHRTQPEPLLSGSWFVALPSRRALRDPVRALLPGSLREGDPLAAPAGGPD